MANIGPKGKEVELDRTTPQEIGESIKDWEKAILSLQIPKTCDHFVAKIDELIAKEKTALARTGPHVSLDKNPLGAQTQHGLSRYIEALTNVRNLIANGAKDVPLADVTYEDEDEDEEETEEE